MITGNLLIFLMACASCPASSLQATTDDAWTEFKAAHGRVYASTEEELHRLHVFIENLDFIQRHNAEFDAGRSSYRLGVNQFADLTNEEFRSMMLMHRQKLRYPTNSTADAGTARRPTTRPASFDWREQGVPITIKDQGQFGDVTTIATVSALEDGLFISSGLSVALSRQNLRDCVQEASVVAQLDYVRDHGIADEASYPDRSGTGPCKVTPIRATFKEVIKVTDGDEDALADGLLKNPAAIEIDAGHASFQLYVSGIYDDPKCSSKSIDHAVLLVGYGASQDTDFWTLANSWGASWGEHGFMRMKRGVNMCGVASFAAVPSGVHSA